MILVSPENADKLAQVLKDFGFGGAGISRDDFLEVDQVIQLGRAPNRIDLLTGISGVNGREAWRSRSMALKSPLSEKRLSSKTKRPQHALKRSRTSTVFGIGRHDGISLGTSPSLT